MSDRAREGLKRSSERARVLIARTLGEPALFAITLSAVVSAIFFSLGVVAGRALGLTPGRLPARGVFFAVTMATYVEGSSLHVERGGASTFARYAFDEFWSFVAGWAILLDYLIVMAISAVVVSEYLTVFWSQLDEGVLPEVLAAAALLVVAMHEHPRAVRGPARQRPAAVALQHRGAGRRVGDRLRPVLGPRRDHVLDRSRGVAALGGRDLRHRHRDRGGDRGGGRLGPCGRDPRGPPRPAAGGARLDRRGDAAVPVRVDRRPDGRARGGRPHGPRRALRRGARAGDRRRLRAGRRARRGALRGGRHRGGDAARRDERADARPCEARLLARHQPPDPQRGGAPAPAPRHPLRDDLDRGGDRLRACAAARRGVPRRPVRLRGDDRVRARPPVRDRAALPRVGPPERLPRAPLDPDPGRARAAPHGLRRRVRHLGLDQRGGAARGRARRSARPGWPPA